jgi:hypothetical protein
MGLWKFLEAAAVSPFRSERERMGHPEFLGK